MKVNILKTGLLIGFTALLGIVNTNAQSRNERPKKQPTVTEIFKQMDANEDGKLSKKELKGPLKDDFSKIDTNEDGYVSKEELENAPKLTRKRKRS